MTAQNRFRLNLRLRLEVTGTTRSTTDRKARDDQFHKYVG